MDTGTGRFIQIRIQIGEELLDNLFAGKPFLIHRGDLPGKFGCPYQVAEDLDNAKPAIDARGTRLRPSGVHAV